MERPSDSPHSPASVAGPGQSDRDDAGRSIRFPIVGIGASAGGLEAFTQLLKALPADTGAAFVLVQHLSPSHPSMLSEILGRATAMPVIEVGDEQVLEPDHVYVIPPNRCMSLVDGRLHLAARDPADGERIVDHFFRTLADGHEHLAIAVVLSGTGSDGTRGLEAIKARGGISFAQDDTAAHDGMPRSAVDSGCVDHVLPPDEIAHELARIARHPQSRPQRTAVDDRAALRPFVEILQQATGVDFSQYRSNTFLRRVQRRMVMAGRESLAEYAAWLRETPAEVEALHQDVLIGVTGFFRDPDSFEALGTRVLPRLLKGRSPQDPMRVWVIGCSTGEEAYSLAMICAEAAQRHDGRMALQLFATDVNPLAVETARAGIYTEEQLKGVSPGRLARFFVKLDGHYRVTKSIREVCVFSRHDVLCDPPFSRMDLISCRNLLIYLDPALQQRVLPTLHYALAPGGALFLGASESVGSFRNLFETEDARRKIYRRKGVAPSLARPPPAAATARPSFAPMATRQSDGPGELAREADRHLLARFAPPGVLVDAEMDILQFRGDTSPFLLPAPGKASLNLVKMLREGLQVPVRSAIRHASSRGAPVRETDLRVRSRSGSVECAVEVVPVRHPGSQERGFLILFEEAGGSGAAAPALPVLPPANDDERARELQELADTRDYLQWLTEQRAAANEELQSANEEIQSANEELQSTNEELETSKEEIQSTNEELITVNDELNNRNLELNRINDDLANLVEGVQMPIVMISRDLRVRRFTPAASSVLGLLPDDIGRPLAEIRLGLQGLDELQPLLREVLDTAGTREHQVQDKDGRWYSLRLRPYKTLDGQIDGVLLLMVDVDALERAGRYTEEIVAAVREPMLVLDSTLRVQTASRRFCDYFRVAREQTENRHLTELGNGQWNIAPLLQALQQVLLTGAPLDDFTVEHEFEHLGRRTMLLNARAMPRAGEAEKSVLLAIEDITEKQGVEQARRESEGRFRQMIEAMPLAVYATDAEGRLTHFNHAAVELAGRTPVLGEERWPVEARLLLPDGTPLPPDQSPMVTALEQGRTIGGIEMPAERPDGSVIWTTLHSTPLVNDAGDVVGGINVLVDITESRQTADRLRQYAGDLEEADRRKDEFLALLAHELRNPLAPISNALQLLKRRYDEPADDNGPVGDHANARVLGILDRQTRLMARLVEDLLDVSRISQGKMELRKAPIELGAVVEQALETARPLCDLGRNVLDVVASPEPIRLNADGLRLTQVFGNLLSNACKFSAAGGQVRIEVARDGEEAVVRIRDDGVGIAADQLSRIFEPFVQVDSASGTVAHGGLGIGLTLVRRVVEMHGGTVRAFSDGPGRGSEFVVRLPVLPEALPVVPAAAERERPAPVAGLRILVVDDNHDSAETMALLFQIDGHETREAHGGAEAIRMAEEFRPDIVLLDLGMPGMDGYEVAREIRKTPWGQLAKVVALSGWGKEDARQRTKAAGFDAHYTKPLDISALPSLLGSPLRRI